MTPLSDQKQGSGAFSSLTKRDILQWLSLVGVNTLEPSVIKAAEKKGKEQKQVLVKNLRLVLGVQRCLSVPPRGRIHEADTAITKARPFPRLRLW
jgi:hypothetical protein